MSQIVFDIYSINDIVPPSYDPQTFFVRYTNGANANNVRGYHQAKDIIEPLLKSAPRTLDELLSHVRVSRPDLSRILDYLFTCTAEIAALEVPGRDTFYIWADAEIAEQMRSQFALGAVSFDSAHLLPEDVPQLTAYITNLLVLRPAIEVLDATIEKTQKLYDAFRIKQSMAPDDRTDRNIMMLAEKLRQLRERREAEVSRWTRSTSGGQADSLAADATEPTGHRHDYAAPQAGETGGASGGTETLSEYPWDTVYVLGSGYNYQGPEREKRICWRDREMRSYDFARVTRVVVEMDTFADDLAEGHTIVDLVESYVRPQMHGSRVEFVFRRVPGITYTKKIGKRLHKQTLDLLERGFKVLR